MTQHQDALLGAVFANLVQVLRRAAVTDEDAIAALRVAQTAPDTSDVSVKTDEELDPRQLELLTSMVAVWGRENTFLDEMGEPLSLPARNADPCIEDIYHRVAERNPALAESLTFDQAFSRLLQHRAIAPADEGSYERVMATFQFNTPDSRAGLLNLEYLNDFLATSLTNLDNPGAGKGLFQRRASTSAFPCSQLPVLTRILEDEGMAFLSEIDDYIEKAADKNESSDTTPVRIQLFMYHEKNKRPLD